HGGHDALAGGHVGVCEVEGVQHFGQCGTVNERVDRAAIGVRAAEVCGGVAAFHGCAAAAHGEGPAPHRIVELATEREQRIANLLEVEALDVCAPEPLVGRVALHAGIGRAAVLLVGGGHDDEL